MNKVQLIGRLTRDPEVRYTQGDNSMCIARYTIAVDRRRRRDGAQNADFIPCTAYGKAGEVVEKYYRKGMKVAVVGRLGTGSYTNRDNKKVYTWEVIVEEQEIDEPRRSTEAAPASAEPLPEGFESLGGEEELPFADIG